MAKPFARLAALVLALAAAPIDPVVEPAHAEESAKPIAVAPVAAPRLAIDAFAFAPADPLPGQTVELRAIVRNASGSPVTGAELRFFQDGRAIGDPVPLQDIAPDDTSHVVLPLRPSGTGRFSFTVAATDGPAGAAARGTAGFTIDALPGWWARLDAELAAADPGTLPASRSVMPSLAGHGRCQADIRADYVLQRHGEALFEGIRAAPGNRPAAEAAFSDAVAALGDFAAMLYCTDLDQIAYWDRAIAGFWRSIQGSPEPDLDFQAAIVATWNPALMVLDAVQFTGHSEIVAAYQDLSAEIDKALAAYPVDSYGAAWLDAFGSGQLYRHAGQARAENLTELLRQPALLGLGTCPLTAHAEKPLLDAPCLEGLARVTQNCAATGVAELLAGLHETGMIAPLLFGNFAAEAARQGLPPAHAVAVAGDQIGTFGTPLSASIPSLCAALQAAGQPAGLQGMAEDFGGAGLDAMGGCAFALAAAGLGGPTAADRALQCLAARGGPGPASPPLSATQVRFPSACSLTDTTSDNDFHTMGQKLYYRQIADQGATSVYSKTDSLKAPFSSQRDVTFSDGSEEMIQETRKDGLLGPLTEGTHRVRDASGETVFEGSYEYDSLTGELLRSVETEKLANGNTQTTVRDRDRDGKTCTTVTETDPSGNTVRQETSPPQTTRPADPEGGGCPETAAQARAMATFNCLFADGLTELGPRGGLAPLIQTLGGMGTLPHACDEIDPGAFWNSGRGATDPVPWEVSGGPIIVDTFIPRIDGVIDPPKEWTGIPRPPGAPD